MRLRLKGCAGQDVRAILKNYETRRREGLGDGTRRVGSATMQSLAAPTQKVHSSRKSRSKKKKRKGNVPRRRSPRVGTEDLRRATEVAANDARLQAARSSMFPATEPTICVACKSSAHAPGSNCAALRKRYGGPRAPSA